MAKLYRLLVVAQALVVFSYCIFSYIYQPNMIYLSGKDGLMYGVLPICAWWR